MDEKDELNLSEEEKLKKIEDEGVAQHLDAHLEQNIKSHEKKKITTKDLITYAAMAVVLIICGVIIFIFLDKNDANPFTKTTTRP